MKITLFFSFGLLKLLFFLNCGSSPLTFVAFEDIHLTSTTCSKTFDQSCTFEVEQ